MTLNTQYFPSETDAQAYTNIIGSADYTISTYGGYSSWRIASNSTGSSSQATIYSAGVDLNSDGNYYLYPASPCFLQGSSILCEVGGVETEVLVENLAPGMFVKTTHDGLKRVDFVAKGTIQNPAGNERIQNRLYKYSPNNYSELKRDLFITGQHSILVDDITEAQRETMIKYLGKIYMIDTKYRLEAFANELAEPWDSEGTYNIWYISLEGADPKMNYGVYANGRFDVEDCLWKLALSIS